MSEESKKENEIEKKIAECSRLIEINPNDVEALKQRGIAYLKNIGCSIEDEFCHYILRFNFQEDFENAQKDIEAAIALNPSDIELYNYLSFIYWHIELHQTYRKLIGIDITINERYAENTREMMIFRRELHRKERYAQKALEMMIFRGALQGPKKAIEILSKAIARDSNSAQSYFNRGRMNRFSWDDDNFVPRFPFDSDDTIKKEVDSAEQKAINDWKMAISLDPHYEWAYFKLASLYIDREEYEKVVFLLVQGLKNCPESDRLIEKRAFAYSRTKEYQKALDDYAYLITKKPESNRTLASYFFVRAGLYANIGKFDCCLEEIIHAIHAFAVTLYLDHEIYESPYTKDVHEIHKELMAHYTALLELDNKVAKYYNYKGILYYIKYEFSKAIFNFEQAIKLDPENAWYYVYLGHCYKAIEKDEKGFEYYSKAVDLMPDCYDIRWIRSCSDHHPRWEVIDDLTFMINQDGASSWHYWSRAEMYNGLGEYEKAIDDYTRDLKTGIGPEPFRAMMIQERSKIYIKLKKWDNAIADINTLIPMNLEKNDICQIEKYELYLDLGKVYCQKGDHKKAVECYNKLIHKEVPAPDEGINEAYIGIIKALFT